LPSNHNKLEVAIVEKFVPHFVPGAKLLYFGRTANNMLMIDKEAFAKLGLSTLASEIFPDVILYDAKKKWLFLIEAVAVKDFISPERRLELENLFENCEVSKVYITAFWNFATYTKNVDKIAWETEVWIAEMPSHMIHLNGEKFLGPR
jgi:type II restriction enzyme